MERIFGPTIFELKKKILANDPSEWDDGEAYISLVGVSINIISSSLTLSSIQMKSAIRSEAALRSYHILHFDPRDLNMLYDERNKWVVFIDFGS